MVPRKSKLVEIDHFNCIESEAIKNKEEHMIEEYRKEITRLVNETTDERELYLIMICARSIAK